MVQKRVSTKDIAYVDIKSKIIKCELIPNQAIVEETLAEELGISRTPLRSAIQRLELEGMIIRNANGRLNVAPVSIKELKDLFIMRSKLEGIVVGDAIDNLTRSDIEHLSYLAEMIKVTSKLKNTESINDFGSQFHKAIYEISNNDTVTRVLEQSKDHITRYRRLAIKYIVDVDNDNEIQKGDHEHQQILEFMISKNKQLAIEATEKHILNTMNRALPAMEKYHYSEIKS